MGWKKFKNKKPKFGEFIIIYEPKYGAYSYEYEDDPDANFSECYWTYPPNE